MKKIILVLAVGILAGPAMAQNHKKLPPLKPPMEMRELPPPPPPPPPASAEHLAFPPPPPAPPVEPVAPKPPKLEKDQSKAPKQAKRAKQKILFVAPVIVKDKSI